MSYRLHWLDKGRPEVRGDARCITSRIVAQAICDEHNQLYPRFDHFFVEIDPLEVLLEIPKEASQ